MIIQVRDVQGASGGDGRDDNPFDWDKVCSNIEEGLLQDGYKRGVEYEIILVPNIVNITYGRGLVPNWGLNNGFSKRVRNAEK